MCMGGSRPAAVAPPPPAMPAPPQPVPAPPAMAPPTVGTIPTEEKMQKKPKTYAARRRAAAGGITGKKRFTIPLGGTSQSGVNV